MLVASVALICVFWIMSVFTVGDMERVLKNNPKNYQELAISYNSHLWFNELPIKLPGKPSHRSILEDYNGWLDEDPSLVVINPNKKAIYSLNLFVSKSYIVTIAYAPDVFLFDENLDVVAWRIYSQTNP